MKNESIEERLKKELSIKRFSHCLRVAETARRLAEVHKLKSEKAYLAGILHDVAREREGKELTHLLKKHKIVLRKDEKMCPGIWHTLAGPVIAKNEYKVSDKEVLEAIRFHSMGDAKMGPVAKIIYIADIIEPERSENGGLKEELSAIRRMAEKDIDKALRMAVAFRIRKSLETGTVILTRGVELWNSLVSGDKKRYIRACNTR
jgi:predicted HD superfamily hydrolase involved in NAD metabolism